MRLVNSGIFRIVVVVFCVFAISQLLFSINNLLHKKDIIGERMGVLKREKQININLKEKITKYHDPFWIEKQIREKLGLAKPGETLIMISKGEFEATKSADMSQAPPLVNWWQLFFGEK